MEYHLTMCKQITLNNLFIKTLKTHRSLTNYFTHTHIHT